MASPTYSVPGLSQRDNDRVVELLQARLACYNDLHLTLKHVHWNVVGRNFIGVHEMIDPQVDLVRGYADEVAERIAAMGAASGGRASDIIALRDWDDYSLGRSTAIAHLAALNKVYDGVVETNRSVIEELGDLDPISEDMMIGHTGQLEKFQWFVRAHLEDEYGEIAGEDARTERGAARKTSTSKSTAKRSSAARRAPAAKQTSAAQRTPAAKRSAAAKRTSAAVSTTSGRARATASPAAARTAATTTAAKKTAAKKTAAKRTTARKRTER